MRLIQSQWGPKIKLGQIMLGCNDCKHETDRLMNVDQISDYAYIVKTDHKERVSLSNYLPKLQEITIIVTVTVDPHLLLHIDLHDFHKLLVLGHFDNQNAILHLRCDIVCIHVGGIGTTT